jgi:large subunit ribosomal protein L13
MGKVAVQAATLLRGKHKPTFAPHADCGDFVIIINASRAVLTGKKLEQKKHYRYTGYIGNLKTVGYDELMKKRPGYAMELAVKGMLPSTTLGRKAFTRLKVFDGAEHKHAAQQPEVMEVK